MNYHSVFTLMYCQTICFFRFRFFAFFLFFCFVLSVSFICKNDVFVISLFVWFDLIFYLFFIFFYFFFVFVSVFVSMFCLRRKSESAESANELHVPSLSKSLSSSGSQLFVSAEKKIPRKPTSLRCESFSKLFLFEKTLFFSLFCFVLFEKKKNWERFCFWFWNAKNKLLSSNCLCQFGLKSFGHLISNWQRFLRIWVCCLCLFFALSNLIWRKRNNSIFTQFEIKTIYRLMSNCGEMGDHFVSSKFEWDFLILKSKEQTLVHKILHLCQFGLRSFGHLIPNWRIFLWIWVCFFVFAFAFVLSSLILS